MKSLGGPNRIYWAVIALFALSRLLRTTGWDLVGDEKGFAELAASTNFAGQIASHGLQNPRAVYGPLTVWIFQVLLAFVNVELWRFVTALVTTAGLAYAMYSLARSCGFLVPIIGGAVFLFPYIWLYSRLIWDYTFLLTALAVAFYVVFLRHRSSPSLVASMVLLTLSLNSHLMGVTSAAAIGFHALFFQWRELLLRWRAVCIGIVLCVIVSTPYLSYLYLHPNPPVIFSWGSIASFGFSFLSPVLMSGVDLSRYYQVGWEENYIPAWLHWSYVGGSTIIYPIFWAAIVWAIVQIRQSKLDSLQRNVLILSLMAQGFYLALNMMQCLVSFVHYANSVWIYSFLLAWVFMSHYWDRRWMKVLFTVYSLSIALPTALLVLHAFVRAGGWPP